jgi:hypothetical protein
VFISSSISGMSAFRGAAERASKALHYEVLRAESFGARPDSPQRACLAGVRDSDVVILLLGSRYGETQLSGLSATHEEYREARDCCDVLVFIQEGVEPEPAQETFIREVRNWSKGLYTENFATEEDLLLAVARSLRDLELHKVAGAVDEQEVMERAIALLPSSRFSGQSSLITVAVSAPCQQVVRPSEIESSAFQEIVQQAAFFGEPAVLERSQGIEGRVDGRALHLEQEAVSVLVDELGSIRVNSRIRAREQHGMVHMALIEEDIQKQIESGLRFAASMLDTIDRPRRLSHVLPVAALIHAGHFGWLTRAEAAVHPYATQICLMAPERNIQTIPRAVPRGSFINRSSEIAQDLTTLLRREMKRL